MTVLLGDTRSSENIEILKSRRWGRICIAMNPKPYPFEPWAFDNGAFVAWRNGQPFPEAEFYKRLAIAETVPMDPLFAVTPDIVAGGLESLEFSVAWRYLLHHSDWRWYLAIQDGMTLDAVQRVVHLFDGIFLGGTDRFKLGAWKWRQAARSWHKPFHYGRCGTLKKLRHAHALQVDSLDSSFPLWTKERMRLFLACFDGLGSQLEITLSANPHAC
jgi:hypothetical protein